MGDGKTPDSILEESEQDTWGWLGRNARQHLDGEHLAPLVARLALLEQVGRLYLQRAARRKRSTVRLSQEQSSAEPQASEPAALSR